MHYGTMILYVLLLPVLVRTYAESFTCDSLPNGCKFEETYGEWSIYYYEIFVCDSLAKSFDFDLNTIVRECKKNETSYTQVYFKLRPAEIIDSSLQISGLHKFIHKMNFYAGNSTRLRSSSRTSKGLISTRRFPWMV